jgi:hypothetical protein
MLYAVEPLLARSEPSNGFAPFIDRVNIVSRGLICSQEALKPKQLNHDDPDG